jgi:hypothetical protein
MFAKPFPFFPRHLDKIKLVNIAKAAAFCAGQVFSRVFVSLHHLFISSIFISSFFVSILSCPFLLFIVRLMPHHFHHPFALLVPIRPNGFRGLKRNKQKQAQTLIFKEA